MGVFDDKEYDKLDWISQAVEPIRSPLNAVLCEFPDELNITFELYMKLRANSYTMGLAIADVIKEIYVPERNTPSWDYNEVGILEQCFEFQVDNGTEIDFEKGRLTGSIKLVKIKHQLDEKQLEKTLGQKGVAQLGYYRKVDEEAIDRLNDVIEIL